MASHCNCNKVQIPHRDTSDSHALTSASLSSSTSYNLYCLYYVPVIFVFLLFLNKWSLLLLFFHQVRGSYLLFSYRSNVNLSKRPSQSTLILPFLTLHHWNSIPLSLFILYLFMVCLFQDCKICESRNLVCHVYHHITSAVMRARFIVGA